MSNLSFFPLKKALRGYGRKMAAADARSGLNVALLAFPQGMAYAAIAGLPIHYGIFGSAIAAILGPIFSGSRFVILGPSNSTAVLLFGAFTGLGLAEAERVQMLPLILVLMGFFLIMGAFLRVATLIQFVSRSVITGYITAAALYIIVNQVRNVFGFTFELPSGSTFLDVIWLTLVNLKNTHLPSLVVSIVTAMIYFFLSRRMPRLPNVAITLILMSGAAWVMNYFMLHQDFLEHYGPVALLSAVDPSTWKLTIPPINMEWVSLLAQTALILAFLAILEGSSVGKSLAARAGTRLNTSQEMLGMGVANIGCAFLSGMPASGSPVRSTLNWSSGATSPMSSIVSGLLVAAAAFTLGPFTRFISVSALGVLIIAIGLSLLNKHVLRVVLKTTKSDATVFFTTFLAALFVRLDFAIILGTATSILLFLKKVSVPELVEYGADEEGQLAPRAAGEPRETVSIVHVEGELFFGATELFRAQMRRTCEDPNLKVVILKMRNAHHLDATSILALEELVRSMSETGRVLLISEARPETMRVFKRSGLLTHLGEENVFPDNFENPTMPTALALRRAKKLLNDKEAQVSIYVGTQKTGKKADD